MLINHCEIVIFLFCSLLLTCVQFGEARLKLHETNENLFNFDLLKRALLKSNEPSDFQNENLSPSDSECLREIDLIKIGLKSNQRWALRIVDAWGKLPSAVLEGNFQDLGGFSECFHIDRNNSHYESKYCMGQLKLNLTSILRPKSNQHDTNIFAPERFEMIVEPEITPRFDLPTTIPGTGIVFGLCIPAVCSMEFLENHFKLKQMNIELPGNSCQFEENASELKAFDWVTIGILTLVSILIILSTVYDIICTMNNREKSQALLAFSIYSNGRKLLSYKRVNSPDMMHCLHGIRTISTQWVVLGHTFMMVPKLPLRNLSLFPQFVSEYHNMFILSALISVDTFFVLSGLLVSINMLKHLEKTKGRINIPILYFHRYIRLTPLLAVSILFSMTLLRFLGNGPLFPNTVDHLGKQCERYWWSTILYVQNYVNPKDICFGHSWYLSVDMQLFLISPFIVYLIWRFKLKAILAMGFLVLGCIGCIIGVFEHYEISGRGHPLRMSKTYYPTHVRYAPWLIGVIAGYAFFCTRGRTVRIPKIVNLLAWAASLATMAAVIFANYPLQQFNEVHTPLEYALYDALSRVGWAIALCYIIFACVNNSGGIVNSFLAHPLWQPISRLCYSIYILHLPVILITMATLKTPQYASEFMIYHTFFGNYILTVFVSLIATLAFESPIVILEKILLGPKKKSDSVNKNHKIANNGI